MDENTNLDIWAETHYILDDFAHKFEFSADGL